MIISSLLPPSVPKVIQLSNYIKPNLPYHNIYMLIAMHALYVQ